MVVDYIYEFHSTLKEGLDISIVGFGIFHLNEKHLINSLTFIYMPSGLSVYSPFPLLSSIEGSLVKLWMRY